MGVMGLFRFMLGMTGVPSWLVISFDIGAAGFCGAVLLLFMPKQVLAQSKLLRTARNKIRRSISRIWELSLQGPFFRIVIWFGRKLCKGRLSSRARAPHGFNLKADHTDEVTVKFSPTKGWNPFHEELFVISWKQGIENWTERTLNPLEDCDDLSGKEKKGDRFKFIVDQLPAFKEVKFRMCAVSFWGRGPWTKEVAVTTLAFPNKGFGFTGRLGPGWEKTGSGSSEYSWIQTRNEIHIRIPVGKDLKGKEIKFKALPTRLELGIVADGETQNLLKGYLAKKINPDDATWYIDEGTDEGRHILITLFKLEMMDRWTRVFDGPEHPEIDERHVQFFVDPLNPGSLGDIYE